MNLKRRKTNRGHKNHAHSGASNTAICRKNINQTGVSKEYIHIANLATNDVRSRSAATTKSETNIVQMWRRTVEWIIGTSNKKEKALEFAKSRKQ